MYENWNEQMNLFKITLNYDFRLRCSKRKNWIDKRKKGWWKSFNKIKSALKRFLFFLKKLNVNLPPMRYCDKRIGWKNSTKFSIVHWPCVRAHWPEALDRRNIIIVYKKHCLKCVLVYPVVHVCIRRPIHAQLACIHAHTHSRVCTSKCERCFLTHRRLP